MTLPFCKPKLPKLALRPPSIPQHVCTRPKTPIEIQAMWPVDFASPVGKDPRFIERRKEDYAMAFPNARSASILDLVVWLYDRVVGAESKIRLLNQQLAEMQEYINRCKTEVASVNQHDLPLDGPPDDPAEHSESNEVFIMAPTMVHEPIAQGPALEHGVQ